MTFTVRLRTLAPMIKNLCFVIALFLVPVDVRAAAFSKPAHALVMAGEPLYGSNFDHFDYVNPDAPKGGTLKLGATGSFDSLNPFIVRGQPALGLWTDSTSYVYQNLMARGKDEPFTMYGLLAESVELADDRSAIIFNLDKRAHFSDGVPVTAEDVIFSWKTLRDKGRPNHRTYYKKVAAAEKLSPTRVKFTFKPNESGAIDREMPLIMSIMPVLPKHDWRDREFDQTTARLPIGSGPYKVASVDMGRQIVYERDPDFWAKDIPSQRGLYNFDRLRIDYYRDDSVSLQAFKAGQYDVRLETSPTKWTMAYDFPAAKEGRVRRETLKYRKVEPVYGYMMNARREPFADPKFREAMQYTFDFAWVNRNLFHNQFKRVDSVFPNSELAAPDLPTGRELEILESYRGRLPPSIFTTPVKPLEAATQKDFRLSLLKAEGLLHKAGYKIHDNVLLTPGGSPVAFEILLGDPADEKVALNWAASLKRLGIAVRVHTVDSAQYQTRLASFDFDAIANRVANSLSPGNEQIYFWGSAAADQKGSRNYAGVKDPVVDALASALPNAKTREEIVALSHALDRVIMQGHYFVPLTYLGADHIASWTRVAHPSQLSLYGNVMEAWWSAKP
ncbi:MAG: extracellular solute-binding protein [Alphaproteobacteria bacterium]|nr:extracellular solute-binding protein [Alphaproteobacteria bacterium]